MSTGEHHDKHLSIVVVDGGVVKLLCVSVRQQMVDGFLIKLCQSISSQLSECIHWSSL